MGFLPQKCIYVDVDGTLIVKNRPNVTLIDRLRAAKEKGFELVLWSARGKLHAERAADALKIRELFSAILSKPGFIFDDRGWTWTKYVRVNDRGICGEKE